MSTQLKLIVPLLSKCIKTTDLTEKAGFVGAYTYNKNRPYLDNHIFLMYDSNLVNKYTIDKEIRFSKSPELYGKEYIRANGNNYTLYTFIITETDIKQLLKGLRHKKSSSFERICEFWNGEDKMVNKYLCDLLPGLSCSGESVPEEDYLMTHEELIYQKKNPGGLKIDSQGFLSFGPVNDTLKYVILYYHSSQSPFSSLNSLSSAHPYQSGRKLL